MSTEVENQSAAVCGNCQSLNLRRMPVRSAFWQDDRLVVIEDIPAIVCADCAEQFYDDTTAIVLDLMRGGGFPDNEARSEMRVPVFSFLDRASPGAEP